MIMIYIKYFLFFKNNRLRNNKIPYNPPPDHDATIHGMTEGVCYQTSTVQYYNHYNL